MANFDVSKEWAILFPPELIAARKSAEDLSRYLSLLGARQPVISNPLEGTSAEAVIVLNSEGYGPEQNGFDWRAAPERVEIYGESVRGLCNGIYGFLAALGIGWPAPGRENLPAPAAVNPADPLKGISSRIYSLAIQSACEPSRYEGENSAGAPWRRFVPAGMRSVKNILKKSEAFAAWAARRRYDAIVLPLAVFAQGTFVQGSFVPGMRQKLDELKKFAAGYDIALEAGGRDLSSLAPRKHFFFHRDFFRMEDGKRKKAHHFCPTNPGAIRLIGKEGEKIFRAAGEVKVFHLWPDKGAETAWCSCPSCRAFTPQEQNRISVNIAADTLAAVNGAASISYYEKPGEGGNIPLRKNLVKMERLPEEKDIL